MQSELFGITSTDVRTFVLTMIAIIVVALLACFWPARRAVKGSAEGDKV